MLVFFRRLEENRRLDWTGFERLKQNFPTNSTKLGFNAFNATHGSPNQVYLVSLMHKLVERVHGESLPVGWDVFLQKKLTKNFGAEKWLGLGRL